MTDKERAILKRLIAGRGWVVPGWGVFSDVPVDEDQAEYLLRDLDTELWEPEIQDIGFLVD